MGGEFAYPVKDLPGQRSPGTTGIRHAGDLLSYPLSKELLHLEIRIAVKALDYANTIRVGDQTIPTLHGFECETGFTAPSGQTSVLGPFMEKQAQSRSDDKAKANDHATDNRELAETTQTLVFVTPELLEGNDTIKIGANAKPSTR